MKTALTSVAALVMICLGLACGPEVAAQAPSGNPEVQSEDLALRGRSQHSHGQPWRDPAALHVAAAPAGAHLTYFGGRVVSNMQVVQVLYGTGSFLSNVSSTTSPSIATFYQGVLNSPYVDWLTEYNTTTQSGTRTNQVIGRGSFLRQVAITPAASRNGATITDAQIQAELAAQIQSGVLPAPTHDAAGNDNTYYAIFFPHGKTISQGGSNSCQAGGFCAYHGTVANVTGFGEVYYGVHPDMQAGSGCDTGCGTGTPFGNYTSVASHEMVEAITDCEVGLATVSGPPLAWYDNTNGEIGDICNAQQGSITGSDGVSYTVQAEFSNVANNCIVTRTVANDFSVSVSPASLGVTAGGAPGTATVSTATTSGSAQTVSLSISGLPAGVTASFSPASVTSGGSSTLTFTASASAAAGTTVVTVTGTATSGSHPATVSLTVSPVAVNDFSVAVSPASLGVTSGGAGGTVTVSTATTSGSAQTVNLTTSGVPAGVTASFSPTSVSSGGSSTLTFVASASAAAGTTVVTVTGTAASGSHTATVSLTVSPVAVNDFSISVSPASQTITAGGSGSAVIATAVTSGSAQTISLSVAGAPAGVTASISPASVSAGQSATLSLTTTAATAAGTYTLTVTGSATSGSHAATQSLTITSGTGGLVNGGFESGLTGWTTTGSAAVSSSGCHGGAGCLDLGLTTPTSGDSIAAQTFTAPAGTTGLSLWFKMSCPDTVTYDWATVTLQDNTAGTTATVLAKTCTTNAWTQKTAAVTAGHSYTLSLVSHDDNYAGDPSYTFYDDVTLTSTAPPPTGITNGGFESGLTGWTTAGAAAAVTTGCHGGTACLEVGRVTPTSGDSTGSQTFTASAGTTSLSVWYKMTCPDTVTYDWATVTLRDNTTGTTATLLGRTCTTNAWLKLTGAVTAGHSYTLTLLSHDDNYSADPSYTLYDDVTLQ